MPKCQFFYTIFESVFKKMSKTNNNKAIIEAEQGQALMLDTANINPKKALLRKLRLSNEFF